MLPNMRPCYIPLLFALLFSADELRESDYFTSALGLLTTTGGGFFAIYCFAKFFLVLEAFISLRKLPLSAYDTPRWTTLLPHL